MSSSRNITPPSAINPESSSISSRRQQRLNSELLKALDRGDDSEQIERLCIKHYYQRNKKKFETTIRPTQYTNLELIVISIVHHIEFKDDLAKLSLLESGASPNATCHLERVSACHKAALLDGNTLSLLLNAGAVRFRVDKLGRTPLHYAAYAGKAEQIRVLLDFSEDLEEGTVASTSSATVDSKKKLIDVQCNHDEVQVELPPNWTDSANHECKNVTMPFIKPGWTALHVASARAQRHCVGVLLAFGADAYIQDSEKHTPLDVVGHASYYSHQISEKGLVKVIEMLLDNGPFKSLKEQKYDAFFDTPLHTAVYLESEAVFKRLLEAGASLSFLNQSGLTPLHVCVERRLENFLQLSTAHGPIDVKDDHERSVLRAAIENAWFRGVDIALQAGADVTDLALDGETPIHAAAALGNLEILKLILNFTKEGEINSINVDGETALFKAITNGHTECVNLLLNHGADIKITLPGDVNVLHVAADNDQQEILKLLLEHHNAIDLINTPTAVDNKRELYGFRPIHTAVTNNNVRCLNILLYKGADIKLRPIGLDSVPTPLHIAAIINNVDMAESILNFDKTTIQEVDGKGRSPLHAAGNQSSREVTILLLKKGADLSAYTEEPKESRRTAIDVIMNNVSKPTEFIEDILDSYISSDGKDLEEHSCRVTVDYSIFMPPGRETKQLEVIKALLKTGNRFNQRRLLIHPLIESFLYLKWVALSPFFYAMIAIQSLFLASFTLLILSTFFYFDTNDCPPSWLHPGVWCLFSVLFLGFKFFQDFHLNVEHRYKHVETWIKLGSLIFPSVSLLIMPWAPHSCWNRHMGTIALLLSWLDMLFLISRFPDWGYYVLMFGKVASNVIKILLTFLFLVFGFSFAFMILMRSEIPFDGPWPAIVKTIVMMTSEFDYGNIFDDDHSEKLSDSLILLRVIFLIFLIVAAIALMNLLTAVAVNEVSELEMFGNIKRLAKQVAFISTFDTLADNKIFDTILPVKIQKILKERKVKPVIKLRPRKYRARHKLPTKLQDAIYDIAQKQVKESGERDEQKSLENVLSDIQKVIKRKHKGSADTLSKNNDGNDTVSRSQVEGSETNLNNLERVVKEIDVQMKSCIEESSFAINALSERIDQMSDALQMILNRLEIRNNESE